MVGALGLWWRGHGLRCRETSELAHGPAARASIGAEAVSMRSIATVLPLPPGGQLLVSRGLPYALSAPSGCNDVVCIAFLATPSSNSTA